jgi:methylmalonyl-CoA/ethylmalonyl-CoA epimerase
VVVSKIHHIGIVVEKLQAAYEFYRDTLGLPVIREAEIPDQGVRAALLAAGENEVELLEPAVPGTGVARFLAKRGEGLHHLCFETDDVAAALGELNAKGVTLIDQTPRHGLAGLIGFIHPSACSGVLVELVTPSPRLSSASSPVRLKRLVIGAENPRASAQLFQRLFALTEQFMNGGPRVMLSVGRGALLMVPREEVGGMEGMVALSMVTEELDAVVRRLEAAGASILKGTGEVTVEPRSSHGVHLHVSRYE